MESDYAKGFVFRTSDPQSISTGIRMTNLPIMLQNAHQKTFETRKDLRLGSRIRV